jgi:hypothetical protein
VREYHARVSAALSLKTRVWRTCMPRSTSSLFRCSTYVTRLEYCALPLPRREAPRPVRLPPLAFFDDEPGAGLGGMDDGGVAGTGDATGGGATAAMETGLAKR